MQSLRLKMQRQRGMSFSKFRPARGQLSSTYNLPNTPVIRFTPDVMADIFLGKIKKWDDQRILAANPGVAVPSMDITVVHRSDGSGTTNIFSDYLAKVSNDWKEKVGAGTALNWPVGLGAKGNPGVAGLVKQTPGSLGYVELIYALQNKMPYGDLRNKKGKICKTEPCHHERSRQYQPS